VPDPTTSTFYTTEPVTYSALLSNAGSSVFGLSSDGSLPSYTIAGFLLSNPGNSLSSASGAGGTPLNSPNPCYTGGSSLPACTTSTIFEFSGFFGGTGTPITPITIFSDDGVIVLDADTNKILCQNAAPQADSPTACIMPAGQTHIEVFYGEVLGPPADLSSVGLRETSVPETPTPEPSSIALLGTGLLAVAGLVRRRLIS
jgi:PEP-CTERM motif